ncbi:methyl-accepting chemotaxis protein [Thauera aromatica K172]|uniref:Methyl-accepting chemotaxis protein n=1 Tax=Thauera aromatica K172 TaxID=44139 RepID=A0A2R4BP85_THAAR|nr:methyl-accepting chemotaxis protein [Thauera aromatica]AVR89147.1 methyl-accepting chemotaxis protein [Thauera aromatica K172]
MKVNLPVTDTEVQLGEGESIVSRTDLRGVITYVNDIFVRVSGYSEDELVGSAHNIVRHPDMPPEAFENLWQTLKAGKPWSGVVKNRCKNGDCYWVVANVTPVREGGHVTGYLSVRSRPTRQQIEEAAALYRDIRAGKAGLAPKPSPIRRLSGRLMALPLGARLYGLVGFLLAGLVLGAIAGLGLGAYLQRGLERVYQDHATAAHDVEQILMLSGDTRAQLLLAAQHSPQSPFAKLHDHPVSAHIDTVQRNAERITEIWDAYIARSTPEMAALNQAYIDTRKKIHSEGVTPARERILAGAYTEATEILLTKFNPLYGEIRQHTEALVKAHRSAAERIFAETATVSAWIRNGVIASLALALALAVLLSRLIVRSVVRPLRQANEIFERIAEGKYDNPIHVEAEDEVGKVLHGLQSMQIRLGFDVNEARRVAAEALRIKVALDCVDTNVRIASLEGKVLYANHAMHKTVQRLEPAIAATVPGFTAAGFIGSDVTRFYPDAESARQQLLTLSQPTRSMLDIGGREFEVVTSPIVDECGKRVGSVGEWRDRTDELAAQRAIQQVVGAAAQGDFGARLEETGTNEFLHELTANINRLLEAADSGLREANAVLGAMADGDLTRRIEGDYQGAFGELKSYTNQTVDALTSMIGQIADAASAVSIAAQQIAKGNQDLSARTEQQASSLEQTAASTEELTSTVRQNADNARQARQMAVSASDIAGKGADAMQQMVGTMGDIHQAAQKIVDIISVIDGIAFQTNILALNAAVEAARAGEQGRGFAVVASEVRSLAQRSAAAAKEIKSLISESVARIEQGTSLADETGRVIADVVKSVRHVTDVVAEISAASEEQSTGIEQVNVAITHMDSVTQQNAALVEQASAAAESLKEQSMSLAHSVSVFRIEESVQRLPAPASLSAPRLSASVGAASSVLPADAAPQRVRQARAALATAPQGEDEWRDF